MNDNSIALKSRSFLFYIDHNIILLIIKSYTNMWKIKKTKWWNTLTSPN